MLIAHEILSSWLSRLVQIPSVTPVQASARSGMTGEAQIALAVAGWFKALGGEVHLDECVTARPSVYGIFPGNTDQWVALDVHTDTVGVEQMSADPFGGEVRAGRVYGRGAVDTKASLAVALALLEALHTSGAKPQPNLLIAATADEEDQARGAPAFAEWVRRRGIVLDQLMVAEPTQCRPIHGHKGVVRLRFDVVGHPAHSAQPQHGKNAISAGAQLALAFAAEHERLQSADSTSALGQAALTVTLISGGRGINIVPDECSLSVDRRVVSGEQPEEIIAALTELAQRVCPLPVQATKLLAVGAFLQEPATPWIEQLCAWSGAAAALVPYGTNAWAYGGLARECVVLGPGSIDQAHGVEEWVAVSELLKLSQIYSQWWGI